MTNKKEFEKTIQTNSINFRFKFIGTEKNNIDYDKLLRNIDNCFNSSRSYDNMSQNIAWIRTLLNNFDEEYLEVNLLANDKIQTIKYIDKNLALYELEENNNLLVKYEMNKELNISLTNSATKKIDYYFNLETIKKINEKLKELNNLQKISIVNLTDEDKALCLIYKLFYGEYPNFNSKNINIKIQSMMAILIEFGICLNDNISFRMNYKKIPISLYLQQKIIKLTPLGKIESIDNSIKLSKYTTEVVKIVATSIKEFIPNDYDEEEVLPKISSIIYTKANMVPSRAKENEIVKASTCSEKSVKAVLKLTKKIDNKIKNM